MMINKVVYCTHAVQYNLEIKAPAGYYFSYCKYCKAIARALIILIA